MSVINSGDIENEENLKLASQQYRVALEPGPTAQICRLAWLYTGGKDKSLSVPAG